MFNFIKKLKNITMKKEEFEQQIADAIAVAQRLGAENKQLRNENDALKAENLKLRDEMDSAIDRVRYLAGQVKMHEAQNTAKTQFSDSDRNY
jgi:cell division protein FtsB